MIVCITQNSSLKIVRQTDHAATCCQIARAWNRPDMFDDDQWTQIILAAKHHDDGWFEEWQKPVLDDDGRPLDFKAIATQDHVRIWRRSIFEAKSHGQFAELLVAKYARQLYTSVDSSHIEDHQLAQTFIDELTDMVVEGAAQIDMSPIELQAALRILTLCDGLSLALLDAIDWMGLTEQMVFGNETSALSLRRDRRGVMVQPWPFDTGPIILTTRAYVLTSHHFTTPEDLVAELKVAAPTELSWELMSG